MTNQDPTGRQAVFERAYLDHFARIRSFLRVYLGQITAVDDLAQETVLQLWSRPDAFDPSRASLRTYLLGIARKKAADWWRHSRPTAAPPSDRISEPAGNVVAMRDALARLDADLRNVLWLREAEGSTGPVTLKAIGARVVVRSIEDGNVQLEIAARNFGVGNTMPAGIGKLQLQPITYVPGQTVEGGGVLTLGGQVLDHLPKIAGGLPLEPGPDQLFVRSPVLIEGDKVVADLQGANTAVEGDKVAILSSPGVGNFAFGLHEAPGAVEAQASWGYLRFWMNGKSYLLMTGAPLCGGEQPRTVWVSFDPHPWPTTGLGSGALKDFMPGGA